MYAAAQVDRNQFFSSKPAEITNFDWLFNRANPFRVPDWYQDFIDLIDRRSVNAPDKVTFFQQPYLVEQLEKSQRSIQYALRFLERFGVIITKRDRQNRHAIDPTFFAPIAPAEPPPRAAPPSSVILTKVADQIAGQKSALKDEGDLSKESSSIIKTGVEVSADDKAVIHTFEAITGAQYQPGRDGATLQALRGQFSQAIILAGVLLAGLRVKAEISGRPAQTIYSLAYCWAAIAEVSKAGIKDLECYLHGLRHRARLILGINLL